MEITNINNRPDSGFTGILILAVAMVLVCLASMCSGCSRKVIETQVVEVPRIEHHYSNTVRCDTVRERDSVMIFQRGDTVFNNVIRHYHHTSTVHDTVNHTDTLTQVVKVPVPKYIEKELGRWQRFKMGLGSLVLWIVGGCGLGGLILWLLLRLRNRKL